MSEAASACQDLGGELVSITTESENVFVSSLCPVDGPPIPNRECWIGLESAGNGTGAWTWKSGEHVSYSHWSTYVRSEEPAYLRSSSSSSGADQLAASYSVERLCGCQAIWSISAPLALFMTGTQLFVSAVLLTPATHSILTD